MGVGPMFSERMENALKLSESDLRAYLAQNCSKPIPVEPT
jgi:hypothetical protein